MPYYVYEVVEQPIRQLRKLAQFPSFKESSAEAKRLRAESERNVKVIFAANELEAEDLLSQVRPAPLLIGDDL
jgi:hypothetical protein